MEERPSWAPDEVDITRPSVARVWDYYLGGSRNFAADREFAESVYAVIPEMPLLARLNRSFMHRAIRHLGSSGVTQFLDLGSGIPSVGNVHEAAAALSPSSRTVYVDHDPVAVTHSRSMLAGHDVATVVQGDLRLPGEVLADPLLRDTLDFSKPIAVLFVSVLHFVLDVDEPSRIVADYMDAVPAGSHLVISHASTDGKAEAAGAQDLYNRGRSPNPMRMRSEGEIAALFGGLELLPPGVVRLPKWRPDNPADVPEDADTYPGFAGVAVKR